MFRLDGDERFVSVTGSLSGWLGTDREALLGTDLLELVHEADRERLGRTLADLRDGDAESSLTCACRFDTAAGERCVTLEFLSSPDTAEATLVGNVTPNRRSEADSPGDTDTRFEQLFALIDDAVVEFEMVDGDPMVRAVNPGFEDAFGYAADAVVDRSLNDVIVPARCAEESSELDQRTADGKPNRAVVVRRTAWGVRDFLYYGIPFVEDGRTCGFAIYADITAQRRSREHLQVLHRVLRHNLRNDMNLVLGMADEIERRSADPTVTAATESIKSRAQLLVETSEKARAAATVVDGEQSVEPVDLVKVVRGVVGRCRDRYPSATIEADLPTRLPVAVGSNLGQALTNLVENAVVHTGPSPTVHLEAERRQRDAVLTVADDGDGILDAEWDAVFGDTDVTQLRHGSGLGLWVVKWVVESAGGRVEYDRTDGWTRVILTLPLVDGDAVDEVGVEADH